MYILLYHQIIYSKDLEPPSLKHLPSLTPFDLALEPVITVICAGEPQLALLASAMCHPSGETVCIFTKRDLSLNRSLAGMHISKNV